MIKVVCIHSGNLCGLTKNKVYDAELAGQYYRLQNDLGDILSYNTFRFINIAECREQQIKTVLDD